MLIVVGTNWSLTNPKARLKIGPIITGTRNTSFITLRPQKYLFLIFFSHMFMHMHTFKNELSEAQ